MPEADNEDDDAVFGRKVERLWRDLDLYLLLVLGCYLSSYKIMK